MKYITLILLFFAQPVFASFDMNHHMQKSYSHIINLEFEKALILLEEESHANNGFIPLYKNYIDFLTIFISEDFEYFEMQENFKDIRLDLLDDNDIESPYYLYSKAEINMQWAFSRLKFKQYPTAIYELLKAYRLLEKNQKKFPEFTLNNKGLGLIHVLLGSIPKEFNWILRISGFKGSVSRGFSELDILLNDDRYLIYEYEVLFLLSFLQINFADNDSVAQQYLNRIGDRYKDNLLLNFSAALISNHLGQNDYCLDILKNRPNNSDLEKFYILDYLEGLCYLYSLDLKNAQEKFEYFIKNYRGLNYIKSANHKLAWIAFLQNNTPMREKYFANVISDGINVIDADKVALRDAKHDYISHIYLLRSRLLYDGGYYSLSLTELKKIEPSLLDDFNEIEYWYRLARVESKLDNNEHLTLKYYKTVLKKAINSSNYYAPMSALQLGQIYEKKNEFKKGSYYFNKCLSMSGFDYERGIHQKAKAGLQRISD